MVAEERLLLSRVVNHDQTPTWPCSSVVEHLYQNGKSHGFEFHQGLKIVFRLLLQFLQLLHNCDDLLLFNSFSCS